MKKIAAEAIKVLVLVGIVVAGMGFAQAWTGPSAIPPGNNVSAPVNASDVTQEKGGIFGAHGFFNLGTAWFSTSTRAYWPSSTSTPTVAVNGSVGATAYCDDNGQNCNNPASQQTFYLPHNNTYHVFFTGYTTQNIGPSGGDGILATQTITRSQLNGISQISKETRKLAGIIVTIQTDLYHTSRTTNGQWYRFDIGPYTDSAYILSPVNYYHSTLIFQYLDSATYGRKEAVGTTIYIPDMDNDEDFDIGIVTTQTDWGTVYANTHVNVDATVIGYVTK